MEWGIELPQCSLSWERSDISVTQVLVAGGRAPHPGWLREIAEQKDVYAADRGGEICLRAGIVPQGVMGDGDSASEEAWQQLRELQVPMREFPVDKDDTDLALLLASVPQVACTVVTGIWGGRFDHLYSAVHTITAHEVKNGGRWILADEKEVMILLQAGQQLSLRFKQNPTAISLLPLDEKNRVSIDGVRWPLKQAELRRSHPYAVSNRPAENCRFVTSSCSEGIVGLYCHFGEEKHD